MFRIRLKGLREERKISQKELANQLGLSQSTIGMWESGKREPNFDTIRTLSNFFEVSVDFLVGNGSEPYFHLDNEKILNEINSYGDLTPNSDTVHTIAAHHDGESWTEEEINEIERFKQFVLAKRKDK